MMPVQQPMMGYSQPAHYGQPIPTPPPQNSDDKNRVDKLCQFVAKNGPGFETMIREKEQNNPKFAFLFGGENNAYYAWMLHCVRQQVISLPPAPPAHASGFRYHKRKSMCSCKVTWLAAVNQFALAILLSRRKNLRRCVLSAVCHYRCQPFEVNCSSTQFYES
jgi:hypothetical protein